jgi:hypothetical protein
VVIWKTSKTGATYTAEDAEVLLAGGTVSKTNTWSNGRTTTNKMKYENGMVSAIFDNNSASTQNTEKVLNCSCPKCGGRIIERGPGFFCENSGQNGTCDVAVWKTSKTGATYTAEDAETLLSGGIVNKTNNWPSGKSSTNKMKYDAATNRVIAIFDDNAAPKVLNCSCPKCGGKIIERGSGFFCENSGQNGTCNVAIWKTSKTGATYTAEDAETLLAGGTVDKTNNWPSGKSSTNKMKYDFNTNRVTAVFDN